MKMILENPPAGYKKEAEYRLALDGEMVLSDTYLHGTDVLQAFRNTMDNSVKKFVVLTPDKPKAEPWDQKTALSAISDGCWFRIEGSKTFYRAGWAGPVYMGWSGGGSADYLRIMNSYQHCHDQVPTDKTKWYPCTKQGYEESSIPF
jgi:hypothetical protein